MSTTRKTKPGAASRRASRTKERRIFPINFSGTLDYAKAYYKKNFPACPDMHLEFVLVGEQQ